MIWDGHAIHLATKPMRHDPPVRRLAIQGLLQAVRPHEAEAAVEAVVALCDAVVARHPPERMRKRAADLAERGRSALLSRLRLPPPIEDAEAIAGLAP